MSPPTAAAAAKRSTQRRTAKTRVHRRVSGPARPARARAATAPSLPRRRTAPTPVLERLGPLAVGGARRLRDSTTVDRLVRGRTWIGLLCVLLIGLVGLNVSLLKLNAAAGRNAEWAKKLRVEHADLQARVSRLRSAEHIQSEGRDMGLVMPAAADVHYLTADTIRDARQAAKRKTFTPPWSDGDIVSSTPQEGPLSSVVPAPAPSAAPATGATGATGVAPTAAPAATTPTIPAQAGTTGAQSVSQQPGTGATVP